MTEQPIKLDMQEYEDKVIFTTNYKDVYMILMTFCDDGSYVVSDENSTTRELNDFHAQCWINKLNNFVHPITVCE